MATKSKRNSGTIGTYASIAVAAATLGFGTVSADANDRIHLNRQPDRWVSHIGYGSAIRGGGQRYNYNDFGSVRVGERGINYGPGHGYGYGWFNGQFLNSPFYGFCNRGWYLYPGVGVYYCGNLLAFNQTFVAPVVAQQQVQTVVPAATAPAYNVLQQPAAAPQQYQYAVPAPATSQEHTLRPEPAWMVTSPDKFSPDRPIYWPSIGETADDAQCFKNYRAFREEDASKIRGNQKSRWLMRNDNSGEQGSCTTAAAPQPETLWKDAAIGLAAALLTAVVLSRGRIARFYTLKMDIKIRKLEKELDAVNNTPPRSP